MSLSGELFLEVLWGHRHVFLETKETAHGKELRKMLKNIFEDQELSAAKLVRSSTGQSPSHDQSVANMEWLPIEENRPLSESGLTSVLARPNCPACVALIFPGERHPTITPLSIPPPVPDAMRNEDNNGNQ